MGDTMPKTPERRMSPVELTVSSPAGARRGPHPVPLPALPWLAAALLGSGAVVLLGWAAVGALVAAGWLSAMGLAPATVLETVSQGWLGLHGVGFTLAGLPLALTPLGLSALVCLAMGAVSGYAVSQVEADELERRPWRAVALAVVACTLTYTLGATLLASIVGAPRQATACFVGAALLSGVGSLLGALRVSPVRLEWLPPWAAELPRAVAAGIGGLATASAIGLVVAIGTHTKQIAALQQAVSPDGVGTALLLASDLAYLPNLLFWSGAYLLGAGFTVGAGTLLTPTTATLGLLPAIPVAGALPVVPPPGGQLLPASGVAAGALAALVLCRRLAGRGVRPHPWAWCWRSALAGLAAGLVWAGLSWFSRGDLGTGRLVGLGPRFPELVEYAAGLTTAGALVAGLIAGVVAQHRALQADEPTVALEGRAAPFGLDRDVAGPEGTLDAPGPRPFGLD